MKGFISQLEEANILRQSWQMSGEVLSSERDGNTLLDEHLVTHVNHPVPEITEEVTVKLEYIIKKRIKNKVRKLMILKCELKAAA